MSAAGGTPGRMFPTQSPETWAVASRVRKIVGGEAA
jgi:hypothetical protein